MVKIEKEDNKSKVIMSYATFMGTMLGILVSVITIFGFLFSIKTDISVIKDQHEIRIRILETDVKILNTNDRHQDSKIQLIETEQNHYHKKGK